MDFHWSLSDSKSPQVFGTLLSILADVNNTVVWMVFTRPLISKSSDPCTNPLVAGPSAPITIGITVILMFHSFSVLKHGLSIYLFFHFLSVLPYVQPERQSPVWQVLFILSTITWSGCLAEIRWSVCVSNLQRILSVLSSRTGSGLCIYHLFVWSNLNFLHNSHWITLPNQSCLVLYSLSANLLHSLILWLIISSQSLYNQHL